MSNIYSRRINADERSMAMGGREQETMHFVEISVALPVQVRDPKFVCMHVEQPQACMNETGYCSMYSVRLGFETRRSIGIMCRLWRRYPYGGVQLVLASRLAM